LGKTLYIKTYGCQMNEYDSARMADVLAPLGFAQTATPEGADMVILNTCHIREKAAEKVFSELGRLRVAQAARARDGGRMLVAVAGCVAQAEGEEILRRAPNVDLVVGPQAYHRLPEMLARLARAGESGGELGGKSKGRGVLDTEFPVEAKFDYLPRAVTPPGASAFLTVQEGCDKFCTFCVVPYTRGAEYSRPVADIVAEAEALCAAGALEITLLGQNVNAYHGAGPGLGLDESSWGLGRLIRRLAEIPHLKRLRYTTSHPRDLDAELIATHADERKLMPYLHLPVQSGSDAILKAMNRGHTADDYRRLVDRLRRAVPEIALSSDFIVGFPGESDRDFAATLGLVGDMGYAQAYSFMYSPRPGTPAAVLAAQVPAAVKAERLAMLQTCLAEQQVAFNRACLGRDLPVLLERRGRKPGQLVGRSPHMQAVHVAAGDHALGHIVDVRIIDAGPNSLAGELADAPGRGAAPSPCPPAEARP